MIKMFPYTKGDIRQFSLRRVYSNTPGDLARAEKSLEDPDTYALTICDMSDKLLLESDEFHIARPIGVVAITKLTPWISELWSALSENIEFQQVAVARACKRSLDAYLKEHKIQRLQAYIRADDFSESARFSKFLGFQCEGMLRKFGSDGKDYSVWARV